MQLERWPGPIWTMKLLEVVPKDVPVVMLVRHSVRDDIPDGSTGAHLPLNAVGVELCLGLGKTMTGRIRSIHSSPMPRCMQTGEELARSAGSQCPVVPDRLLGAPGAYVLDEVLAWQNWLSLGNDGVIRQLMAGGRLLPGMAEPASAAAGMIAQMLETANGEPGLHLFISHDAIVAPTVAHAMKLRLDAGQWPQYLDAAFFWRDENSLNLAYRDLRVLVEDFSGRTGSAGCDA